MAHRIVKVVAFSVGLVQVGCWGSGQPSTLQSAYDTGDGRILAASDLKPFVTSLANTGTKFQGVSFVAAATDATATSQVQRSPILYTVANAWNTTTLASQGALVGLIGIPTPGNPITGRLAVSSSINDGAPSEVISFSEVTAALITRNGIGSGVSDMIRLQNTTPAGSSTLPQRSPSIILEGRGFRTTPPLGNQPDSWRIQNDPTYDQAGDTAHLDFAHSFDNSSFDHGLRLTLQDKFGTGEVILSTIADESFCIYPRKNVGASGYSPSASSRPR